MSKGINKIKHYQNNDAEPYDSDDEFGEGIHIHGGALASNEIRGLLDASYDKNIKNVDGGWVQDEDLSTGKSKVFYNPTTGKTAVSHRGTVGTMSDWSNNAAYALGGETLYKTTDRYKQAKAVQKAAEQKYGRDNLTTLGHSQGGLQAELLGKKGKETFTLNKATKPFSNKPGKNQTDIRTTTDWVSALNPFSKAKNTQSISLKGFNPLKAHATTSMKKLGSKMLGFGICACCGKKCKKCTCCTSSSDEESISDEESSSDEEMKLPKKRGRPSKGGTILGKLKKGFKKEIIQPTKQVVKQEIVKPTKETVKYVTKKNGLASDLLYKGVPMTLSTLGGIAGTMATGGPVGTAGGAYAGEMAGKLIAQKIGRKTKMGSDTQRGVGTKDQSTNKIVRKYITKKKGGLASDLLHHGVPIVTGGLGGIAGTMLTGGPIGGMAGSEAGYAAGDYASDYIGKKIGVGLKKRGRPKKQDVNIDIDINSHNASGKSKTINGGRFKKGSQEAKDHMKRIREMKR